jgi:hypothetical protein
MMTILEYRTYVRTSDHVRVLRTEERRARAIALRRAEDLFEQ